MNPAEISLFKKFINVANSSLRFGAITTSAAFQATNFAIDLVRTATVSKYRIFAGRNGADIAMNTISLLFQFFSARVKGQMTDLRKGC